VIHADGEFQAAEKLASAAQVISEQPAAVHLRFLQSLVRVGAEKNFTFVVPIPVDLFGSFLDKSGRG